MHLFNLLTNPSSGFLPVTSYTVFLLPYLKIYIIWGRSFFWLPRLLVVIFSKHLQNLKLYLFFRSVSRVVGNTVILSTSKAFRKFWSTESQNCFGWKRPSRASSPTIYPVCQIITKPCPYMSFKYVHSLCRDFY